METSVNIQLRIVILHILLPLVPSFVYFVFFHKIFSSVGILMAAGFTLIMLWSSLSKHRKYINNIEIKDAQLFITYFTPLLRTKEDRLSLSKVSDTEIVRHILFLPYSKGVNIKFENLWFEYHILSKTIEESTKQCLAAVNILANAQP